MDHGPLVLRFHENYTQKLKANVKFLFCVILRIHTVYTLSEKKNYAEN